MIKLLAVVPLALSVAGCITSVGPSIGARELIPPQKGIFVGALYYAREAPSTALEPPVALEAVCDPVIDLAAFGVANPQPYGVGDVNLLNDVRFNAALSAINSTLANAKLAGSVSDYFEYKLTKVVKYAISDQSAETVYQGYRKKSGCLSALARRANFGTYQVAAVYVGDLVFTRKQNAAMDADISLKLDRIEPGVKASFQRVANLGFSGEGLVFSFVPINRNAGGS